MNYNTILKESVFKAGRAIWANMHTAVVIPINNIFNFNFFGKDAGTLTKKGTISPGDTKSNIEFLSRTLSYNLISSVIQSPNLGLEAAVSELMFITGSYWYYKFLINPQNFSLSNTKLQNISETSDITIINTYRNQAPTLNLSGISGCTLPRKFMQISNTDTELPTESFSRYPKLSAAWVKFRQLEKFYNDINSDVVLMYDMDLYVGKFVSFNYNQDANNPWVINYDLQMRIYPGMVLHTTTVYDYAPFFNKMVERYATQFSKNFEGK
jgi:hypothetical protein